MSAYVTLFHHCSGLQEIEGTRLRKLFLLALHFQKTKYRWDMESISEAVFSPYKTGGKVGSRLAFSTDNTGHGPSVFATHIYRPKYRNNMPHFHELLSPDFRVNKLYEYG